MAKLSVVVITHNEERNIERCLKSVQWADEIIVVDSFSTDRTVEIAKFYTSSILQHEFDGDIPQRERGFALAKSDWLLYIDADEEVTDELKNEILSTIASPHAKDGYYVTRKVCAFGKWIEHGGWFPDYTFRLFKKDKYLAEYAEVHGGFTVRGEKGKLQGFLLHYTYNKIEDYLEKMNVYTSLQVSNKLKDNPHINIQPLKLLLSPLSHFYRMFIVRKGYKDGLHGFLLACLGALYVLALYAKVWEYRYRKERNETLPPITNVEVQRFKARYH